MIRLKDLLLVEMADPIFTKRINSKKTSMSTNSPAPSLVKLASSWSKDGLIIDYGCGQKARNAIFLRNEGFERVYSYDPEWGVSGVDGYSGITSDRPSGINFDIGFTSFVLNVVNTTDETDILNWMALNCKREYHIVRNADVKKMIKTKLKNDDQESINFYKEHGFDMNQPVTSEFIDKLASFGIVTTMGFQRVPELKDKGYTMYKDGDNKVYIK